MSHSAIAPSVGTHAGGSEVHDSVARVLLGLQRNSLGQLSVSIASLTVVPEFLRRAVDAARRAAIVGRGGAATGSARVADRNPGRKCAAPVSIAEN